MTLTDREQLELSAAMKRWREFKRIIAKASDASKSLVDSVEAFLGELDKYPGGRSREGCDRTVIADAYLDVIDSPSIVNVWHPADTIENFPQWHSTAMRILRLLVIRDGEWCVGTWHDEIGTWQIYGHCTTSVTHFMHVEVPTK